MGKLNDWLIGREEDATWMSREEWSDKHGTSNVDIYDRVNDEISNELAMHSIQSLTDFLEGR
mgnify:FL=1